MAVPKILHQTWKTHVVPPSLEPLRQKWLSFTPDYEHPLYDDADLRALIQTHFPRYLKSYDTFTQNIERVDFARIAILYVYGGGYADLDTEPLRSIDAWLQPGKIVLGREPLEHARKLYNREVVLCNAFIISPPRQQLWLDFLDYIVAHYEPYYKPVDNTGPMALTKFYEAYPSKFSNVVIADPCVFFPLLGDGSTAEGCNLEDSYLIHHWRNTWVTHGPTEWLKTYGLNKRLWMWGLLILFSIVWMVAYIYTIR